jgi:hypothetical protein
VDDHLVDHRLGAKGRGKADQLDEERRGEHVAPDALVLEKLCPEPPKAELPLRWRPVASRRLRRSLALDQEDLRLELLFQRRNWRRLRRLAARHEIEEPLRIPLGQNRGPQRVARKKAYAGKHCLGEFALARAKAQRVRRLHKLLERMRRGKALEQKRRIERNPVDPAQTAEQPRKVRPSHCFGQLDCHTPLRGD